VGLSNISPTYKTHIRLGRLELGGENFKTTVTQVPKDLNDMLAKLDLLELFAKPPAWTEGQL
jgi:hypothetical protein